MNRHGLSNANKIRHTRGLDTTYRAWDLRVKRGLSVTEIAHEMRITKGAVSKALKRGDALAMDAIKDYAGPAKARAIERYEYIWKEAIAGWEASKGERVRKLSKRTDGPRGANNVAQLQTTDSPGDVKFLKEARNAQDAICKLAGLWAAIKVEVTDEDRPFRDVTEADLQKQLAVALKEAGIDAATLMVATAAANPSEGSH